MIILDKEEQLLPQMPLFILGTLEGHHLIYPRKWKLILFQMNYRDGCYPTLLRGKTTLKIYFPVELTRERRSVCHNVDYFKQSLALLCFLPLPNVYKSDIVISFTQKLV